jgi:23S rRNA pseudouridine2605 synthase
LDLASEGLLLFTNDTQLAHRILSPESHLPKTYYVRVHRPLVADELRALNSIETVNLGGELTMASKWASLAEERNPHWISATLHEGKNRQVRRMLAGFGIKVQRLLRVAIGPLEIGTLARGAVRDLTSFEIHGLGGFVVMGARGGNN